MHRAAGRSAWRWENVPVPELHLAALGLAALAHVVVPVSLPFGRQPSRAAGGVVLGSAVGLGAWAVHAASAASVSVDQPSRLVVTGPYAIIRNPMYVAWSIGMAGLGIALQSAWLVLGAAVATRAVHQEVLREEEALSKAFGNEYDRYRSATSRYVPEWPVRAR
ncbi:MAG TPA: isoprenylcysteine carboxylmethyltransferase family protein [Candidatus Limnocylindria bacterium]